MLMKIQIDFYGLSWRSFSKDCNTPEIVGVSPCAYPDTGATIKYGVPGTSGTFKKIFGK